MEVSIHLAAYHWEIQLEGAARTWIKLDDAVNTWCRTRTLDRLSRIVPNTHTNLLVISASSYHDNW